MPQTNKNPLPNKWNWSRVSPLPCGGYVEPIDWLLFLCSSSDYLLLDGWMDDIHLRDGCLHMNSIRPCVCLSIWLMLSKWWIIKSFALLLWFIIIVLKFSSCSIQLLVRWFSAPFVIPFSPYFGAWMMYILNTSNDLLHLKSTWGEGTH